MAISSREEASKPLIEAIEALTRQLKDLEEKVDDLARSVDVLDTTLSDAIDEANAAFSDSVTCSGDIWGSPTITTDDLTVDGDLDGLFDDLN